MRRPSRGASCEARKGRGLRVATTWPRPKPVVRVRPAAVAAIVMLAASALAAPRPQTPMPAPLAIHGASCPPVVDPKLPGGAVKFAFTVRGGTGETDVTLFLQRDGVEVGTIAVLRARADQPSSHVWNGRTVATAAGPIAVVPGRYEVELRAIERDGAGRANVRLPLQVVRLGVTAIAALPNGPGTEWQMVYFKRGTQATIAYFATPSLHEYRNVADTGQVSDLDLDDGEPRPPAPLHIGTASPPMEGLNYEDDCYNFPLCYRVGAEPVLEVTFGANCTGPSGQALAAGYPIPGVQIRCALDSTLGPWTTSADKIAAGGRAQFVGPALPLQVGRTDATLFWRFESSVDDGGTWASVPGGFATHHRFYTILAAPKFATTIGVQNSGPWVEVVDHVHTWKTALGIDTGTAAGTTRAVVLGFGGQVGPLATAIEGVRYDAYPLGGNGGASHYYLASHAVQLGRLLDAHANGVFVNCSDCASSTAAMLGMLGIGGVQMNRLGPMTLRAIRGIGAPAYTLNLWGGSHGFSYHHVVTRDGGASICDACLWVDEDGNPSTLPGTPGYNVDRPWTGTATAYATLLATAPITFLLQPLPLLY